MVKFILLFFLTLPLAVSAQVGGRSSFEFLDVPVNARASALGGNITSLRDSDPVLFLHNPAAINPDMNKHLSLTYMPYFADVKATQLAYGIRGKKNKNYALGLTFFDYGKMSERLADGTEVGSFRANEYAITGGASHVLGNYVIGANLKIAGSHIGEYNSFAILTDLGGMFIHPERDWIIGFTIKNLGYAFSKYTSDTKVGLPFEIQIGTSYKLENLPLRFTVTAHNLQQPDIVYLDPDRKKETDLQGNEIEEKKKIGDQIFRHFSFGGEILLSQNFNIRVGYNHLQRKELRLVERSGGAGFSAGFMLRISAFEFAYTRNFYHVAGASNHLTVTTNFSDLITKRERKNINPDSND